jgi:hypothetical protein
LRAATPFFTAWISARHIRYPRNYTSSISGYAKRGLFAVGDSAFENFDPTQHALPSAPKVKSQTGRKDS